MKHTKTKSYRKPKTQKTAQKLAFSKKTKKLTKTDDHFRAEAYPLLIRFIDGYLVVSAPDFHFPIPALKRIDLENPNLRAIGEMVFMTYLQIVAELKERDRGKRPHPQPSSPEQAIPRPSRVMSLTEASKKLGLRPHVARALADSGEIRASRTPGGHRRFLRDSVESYLRKTAENSETSGE
ncbi:MAG: hypothetical protein RJB38_2275 [Pseudomonadota bacterium]|jgi:excisionase family DNA binding protein